jgi:hypothetical protein
VTPANVEWLMIVIYVLGGFFDTGIGLIGFNILLGVLPEKSKPSYLALFEAVVGTLVGVSPALGGLLAEKLPHTTIAFISLDSVLSVIAVSTVLRLFPLVFVTRLPSGPGGNFGFMMREFVLINPFKLFPNLTFVKKSPEKKVTAIDNLSQMRSKAALPDLVKSIHDLNPRVRRRAVQALGEIGDHAAYPALAASLDDPLEDIQGEAILALGKLGDTRALSNLLGKLASTDAHLQQCAAMALGDLKDPAAAPGLIGLLERTSRTAVMLACADALGRLGDIRVVEPLLKATRRLTVASVKHSVVASTGTLIDLSGDLYQALSEPTRFSAREAEEILSFHTVRIAQAGQPSLKKNLAASLKAFHSRNFNEAILEMKVVNQVTVRECLARKELKDAMGFEPWVKLLDSNFGIQLMALNELDPKTGVACAIVDYYARHCPSPAEPDMDNQEFLLALFAFKAGQIGLSRMLLGHNAFADFFAPRIDALKNILDVD